MSPTLSTKKRAAIVLGLLVLGIGLAVIVPMTFAGRSGVDDKRDCPPPVTSTPPNGNVLTITQVCQPTPTTPPTEPTGPTQPTDPTPTTDVPFFPSAASLALAVLGAGAAVALVVRKRA